MAIAPIATATVVREVEDKLARCLMCQVEHRLTSMSGRLVRLIEPQTAHTYCLMCEKEVEAMVEADMPDKWGIEYWWQKDETSVWASPTSDMPDDYDSGEHVPWYLQDDETQMPLVKSAFGSATAFVSCKHDMHKLPLVIGEASPAVYLSSNQFRYNDEKGTVVPNFTIGLDGCWRPRDQVTYYGIKPPKDLIKAETEPRILIPWPDGNAPSDVKEITAIAKYVINCAFNGNKVRIGCIGGHGRTGTMAALLVLLSNPGLGSVAAIDYVRSNYCKKAIESYEQELFLSQIAGEPETVVQKPKPQPRVKSEGKSLAQLALDSITAKSKK